MSANQPKPRGWVINGDPFVADDDETLAYALDEARIILSRIGGAITVAAQRTEVAEGHYHTTGYVFRWNSFMPAKRLEVVSDEPEPVDSAA